MTAVVGLADLTEVPGGTTIEAVPPSFKPAESFGAWLKYLRGLTGLTQEQAAKDAGVSFDAVKRMERGKLVGSTHLLAWLSWLGSAAAAKTDEIDADELEEAFTGWSEKALLLGMRIRDAGLALQPPKAKSGRHTRVAPSTDAQGHPVLQSSVVDRGTLADIERDTRTVERARLARKRRAAGKRPATARPEASGRRGRAGKYRG